jgi:hypothetical protein
MMNMWQCTVLIYMPLLTHPAGLTFIPIPFKRGRTLLRPIGTVIWGAMWVLSAIPKPFKLAILIAKRLGPNQ